MEVSLSAYEHFLSSYIKKILSKNVCEIYFVFFQIVVEGWLIL